MFESSHVEQLELTSDIAMRFALAPPIFAGSCVALAWLFSGFYLTDGLVFPIVVLYLIGLPILVVIETMIVLSRYDEGVRKGPFLLLLWAIGVATWMIAGFAGLHVLPIH